MEVNAVMEVHITLNKDSFFNEFMIELACF